MTQALFQQGARTCQQPESWRDEVELTMSWTGNASGIPGLSSWSTDAVAWHGNSGGPVFDADGSWIGVLVGAFNGGPDNEGPDLSVVLPLF
jgi:hypothetical protein